MLNYKLHLRKKGNLDDIPEALMILLGFVFIFFLVSTVLSNFNTTISTNNQTNSSEAAMNFLDTYESRYNKAWDYGALFLAILLPAFSYFAAKRLPTRPSTMIVTFFLLMFFILISMIVSNIYGRMLENATFLVWTQGLTFIPFLMPKLLYYSLFYILIVIIGLFGKEEGTL